MSHRFEHRRFIRWMSLDIDGRLPGTAHQQLATHLATCADCRRRRELLLAARADFQSAGTEPASPGFADRVMAALDREVVFPWMEALPLVRGLVAAGLAICLVTGSLLLLGSGAPGSSRSTELPMGQLDPVTRQLFETGSVPPGMHPAPRTFTGDRR
ncbi:MAG: zf-HC2 domain-containing protein [Planctomycetes bacterium]|nr:zf-HC2 domain-containing protein [Planctomycetota bacterium]MBI3846288.1 zf-HC2 domain-containing protein [Planctomycetota bacterium]